MTTASDRDVLVAPNPNEPNAADFAASKACTQSGAVALLLSVALLLLIPYWLERPREIALGQYVTYRVNLAVELDVLDADPVWQNYKATQESAESMSIAQLLAVTAPIPDGSTGMPAGAKLSPATPTQTHGAQQGRPSPPSAPTKTHSTQHIVRPSVPNPPHIISVTVGQSLYEMSSIAGFLNKLNDPQLLSKAMQESNDFTFSIIRWGDKRNALMYRNSVLHSCTVTQLEVPTIPKGAPTPDFFVPLLDKDALLKCLALGDVRELATFELPSVGNPPQVEEHIQKQVDVKPESLPGDLYTASVVAQMFLFFVIIYFGAFAHEAVSSPAFPAQGTLFGAFSGSRWTLPVMLLALWTPLFSSVAMSVISRKWLLIACNTPIFLAVLFAHLMLRRRSYFGLVRPRALWESRRKR